MVTNDLELRIATDDDFTGLAKLTSGAFLHDLDDDEIDVHRMIYEPGRTYLVCDGPAFVGTGAVLTRDLSVPGAVLPAAHVTGVAVASTHRRRGVLSSIMGKLLSDVREGGVEPLAVLWASESAIYGRFGYGLASWRTLYDITVRETSVPGTLPPGAQLRGAVPSEVTAELSAVFDRVRSVRPGISSRPGRWWEHLTADAKSWRNGMSAERAVIYEDGEGPRGYALYRVKSGWGHAGPDGDVRVSEVVAETPEATAALWRFLLSIDLVRTVKYNYGAVDDPLPYIVTGPDGLGASTGAALWVRVVDVPAALAARRYAVPVDAVIEVSDAAFPDNAGRWHLTGDATTAKCHSTDAEPDLSLDVRELGSVYLGGATLTSLAAGGLVTERAPGALAAVSPAFGWYRAPASVEVF